MDLTPEILVADPNPHIRRFLKRELTAAGYHVRVVENGKQLLAVVHSGMRIDLLVLDPDFPCRDAVDLLHRINTRIPRLPVVLHCVHRSDELPAFKGGPIAHVEKNGNSIETLEQTIRVVLTDIHPSESVAPPV